MLKIIIIAVNKIKIYKLQIKQMINKIKQVAINKLIKKNYLQVQ